MSFCLLKSIHLSILRIINLVVKLQLNKPYISPCGELFAADFYALAIYSTALPALVKPFAVVSTTLL